MHLEGRPLLEALPRAVDRIDDYEWIDGEMFAGMVIGWNFGDGHLNNESLLRRDPAAVRLRAGRAARAHGRVAAAVRPDDALEDRRRRDGVLEEGETEIEPMRAVQPYPTGRVRRGLRARAAGATA